MELGVALGADPESAGHAQTLAALGNVTDCAAEALGGEGGAGGRGGDDTAVSSHTHSGKAGEPPLSACIEKACATWAGGVEASKRLAATRRALALTSRPKESTTERGGSQAGTSTVSVQHLQAVQALCTPASAERVTVTVQPFERARQAISAVTAFQVWALFRVCGVVALREALPIRSVETAANAAREQLETARPTIASFREARSQARTSPDAAVAHLEEETIASRDASGSDLRYELKMPVLGLHASLGLFAEGFGHDEPAGESSDGESVPHDDRFAGGVVDSEVVLALSKLLLHGNSLVVDTLSTIVSLPGCPPGHWHADIDDPRDAAWSLVGGARHAPPPGLVAVVPLVNMSRSNGPTEFLLGSHVARIMGEDHWWQQAQAAGDPMVRSLELALDVNQRDVVLFDVRLRHRGGANRSPSPRPILYVGYNQRWFQDTVNFQTAHTSQWHALGSRTHRALFARKDAEAYIRTLEAQLAARGVDVTSLRSGGRAAAVDTKAGELVV